MHSTKGCPASQMFASAIHRRAIVNLAAEYLPEYDVVAPAERRDRDPRCRASIPVRLRGRTDPITERRRFAPGVATHPIDTLGVTATAALRRSRLLDSRWRLPEMARMRTRACALTRSPKRRQGGGASPAGSSNPTELLLVRSSVTLPVFRVVGLVEEDVDLLVGDGSVLDPPLAAEDLASPLRQLAVSSGPMTFFRCPSTSCGFWPSSGPALILRWTSEAAAALPSAWSWELS